METYTSKISLTNRITRVIVGSGFIGVTMAANGTLGYLVLLPLLAIYPIVTGLLGEDPIDGIIASVFENYEQNSFRPSSRAAMLLVGVGAIGIVMLNPESVASTGWLALVAVYPIMAGLFGEDLVEVTISGLMNGNFGQPYGYTQPTQSVLSLENQERVVYHQGQSHQVSANSHHKHAA